MEREKITGAEIIVKALQAEGVEVVFGIPGGAVLPLYHELAVSPIRHILTRHEQGAAHAADGYARASGKAGVCIATSGPGATNLVTGIATAYMDSVPLVAITGQVPTGLIGKDAFQEADITGITMPITKANYLVTHVKDLAPVIREAFYVATTGRPGPVLIDIPRDITTQRTAFQYPPKLRLRGYRSKIAPHPLQVAQAAAAILESERPLLFIGGGVIASGAHEKVRELAELQDIPVVISLMGKGGFPENHPLFVGMVGMHGTVAANYAVSEADLLIGVGVRFDDRATGKVDTFAPKAKIIHIDIDAAEIGKIINPHIPIVADAREALEALLAELGSSKKERPLWREIIEKWQEDYPLGYEKKGLKPQYVIEQLNQLTGGKAIVATDVGQHQMWAAQYYRVEEPRSFLTSGGLGTMGFGLPAAIGAAMARPGKTVVLISGDGSFQMNIQELATLSHYRLPVKILIINNGFLGMVRQWQELFYERRYAYTQLVNPNFSKVAEAYGIPGRQVFTPEEVVPALEEALSADGPFLLDFLVEPEENVLPMVPPGQAISKMLTRGEGS
ncbi:MAG TPA: biosynthetic-type acetolactate synthase large subunit [Moorella mulderi]|nr:biosynthetic-type acetolactate synthase large subunit [Moorella mulderi]